MQTNIKKKKKKSPCLINSQNFFFLFIQVLQKTYVPKAAVSHPCPGRPGAGCGAASV